MARFEDEDIGGMEYGPVRWRFFGDDANDKELLKVGRVLLGNSKRFMALSGLTYFRPQPARLRNGVVIQTQSIRGHEGLPDMDEITIDTRGGKKKYCLGYLLRVKTWRANVSATLPSGILLNKDEIAEGLVGGAYNEYSVDLTDYGAKWIDKGRDWAHVCQAVERNYGSDVEGGYSYTYFSDFLLPWTSTSFDRVAKRVDDKGVACEFGGIYYDNSRFNLTTMSADNGYGYVMHLAMDASEYRFQYDSAVTSQYPHTKHNPHSDGYDAFNYSLVEQPFGIPIAYEEGYHIIQWNAANSGTQLLDVTLFIDEGDGEIKAYTETLQMPTKVVNFGEYYDVLSIKIGAFRETKELMKDIYSG